MLERNLKEFDVTHLSERLDEIHGIEHAADQKKHEMLAALVKEFITPIEREDIILLSEAIDEVTDTIEDVMIRLYDPSGCGSICPFDHTLLQNLKQAYGGI